MFDPGLVTQLSLCLGEDCARRGDAGMRKTDSDRVPSLKEFIVHGDVGSNLLVQER